MADGRVAGERLDVVDGPLPRPADERALDPAVLIPEYDLQVEDVLAVALEAEVAWLDHAGVHGPDTDLVHLVTFDPEQLGRGERRADRLRPGMADRAYPPFLRELALEPVRLRAFRGERAILAADHGRRERERPVAAAREHGGEIDARIRAAASEERRDARARADLGDDRVAERLDAEDGTVTHRDELPVPDADHPRPRAASSTAWRRADGT